MSISERCYSHPREAYRLLLEHLDYVTLIPATIIFIFIFYFFKLVQRVCARDVLVKIRKPFSSTGYVPPSSTGYVPPPSSGFMDSGLSSRGKSSSSVG